jgi:hypothetical protein
VEAMLGKTIETDGLNLFFFEAKNRGFFHKLTKNSGMNLKSTKFICVKASNLFISAFGE